MNDEYLKALRDSGIIQYLRKTIPESELEAFDKLVEEKTKEYNQMWLDTQPMIAEYNNKVKQYATESKSKSGQPKQSDDK